MVSISSCAKMDCVDLRASKQALESSIVAWLKNESNSLNPSNAEVSVADFETDCPNDDTSSNVDHVSACSSGYRGTAFEQPWRLSIPPLKVKFILQTGEHDYNHQVPPFSKTVASLASEWKAEVRTMPHILGVQLHRSESTTGVQWTVDAKKVRSKAIVVVSSPFMLPLGGQLLPFRMMLVPTLVCKTRRGHCFKQAEGRGSVQLKCDASDLPQDANTKIQYSVRVGWERFRGPKEHDFRQAMVCGLPRDQEDWNFAEAEDVASRTFTVHLEVLHNVLK